MPLSVASTSEEKVTGITASPVTKSGRPAQVDGPLRLTVQSGDATVFQDPATPLVFDVISGDAAGESTILVEADADLGAGVTLISDLVTYNVTGVNAAAFGLSGGTVVPK